MMIDHYKNGVPYDRQFKYIQQGIDEKNCVACAACMATRTDLSEWYAMFDKKETYKNGYSIGDLNLYLAHHGYILGWFFQFEQHKSARRIEHYSVCIDFKGRALLLTVESKHHPGALHMVFWDGDVVWDSAYYGEGNLPLEEYKIKEVYAFIKILKENPLA